MRSFLLTVAVIAIVVGCQSRSRVSKSDMMLADPKVAAPKSVVHKPKKGKAHVHSTKAPTPGASDAVARSNQDLQATDPALPPLPWYKGIRVGSDHYHVDYDFKKDRLNIEGCDGEREKKEKEERDRRDTERIEKMAAKAARNVDDGSLREYKQQRCMEAGDTPFQGRGLLGR